jgi:hypothetical protein
VNFSPDNYLKLTQENNSFESFLSEALDQSSNISQEKMELKDNFKAS